MRPSPDWGSFLARLDELCAQKGLLTKAGQPNYAQLADACGLSRDSLHAVRRRERRPRRPTVEKLAHYAGHPLEPWLRAAGLPEEEHLP